jgi:hypothetical protein
MITGGGPDLEGIRDSVAWLGRVSDAVLRIGPFSLGLDGVLAWIPGLGEVYSAGAAAFLLIQGLRARAPLGVLAASAALMALRTGIGAIPLAGSVFADLFTAHKWSARLIVRAIDRRLEAGAALRASRRAPQGALLGMTKGVAEGRCSPPVLSS